MFWLRHQRSQPIQIAAPDWIRRPSPQQFTEFYPGKAQALGHSGRAVLQCKIRADGTMEECRIAMESPPGEGFGEAAMRMSTAFQMKPMSIDGKPVGGSQVRIPINFAAGGQLDPLTGTLRCYGRMASIAEADPSNTEAWTGVRFWLLQSMGAAAAAHLPPSSVEGDLENFHISAAAQKNSTEVKYETEECTRAMKKALGK